MNTKLAKLNATDTANEALERMLVHVNDRFSGGRVTKTQLTSWIILNFEKSKFEKSIPRIRQAHFDEVSYLESVVADLKRSKREGAPQADFAAIVSKLRTRSGLKKLGKPTSARPQQGSPVASSPIEK